MNDLILRLLTEGNNPQDLALLAHQVENSILDTAKLSSSYVFCDHKYTAQFIHSHTKISNLKVFVNGEPVSANYIPDTGMITFFDESFGARIFLECYGFVQITIVYDDEDGNHHVYDTEYIQVMVRKGKQNDSVKRMTEYVYSQNAELLYGKTLPKETAGLKEHARKTLESRILLLEKIAVVYEENYRYFKTNCRYKTVPRECIDHFEKLQYVSSNTLQYIAQHPEELQPVYHSAGIRVGKNYYQPNKTLVTNNIKSYDIYENCVVVGFLKYLNAEVGRIEQELISITTSVPQQLLETDEYVTSSYFIYASTISALKIILADIRKLRQKYEHLYFSYSSILPINAEPISGLPQFTHIFRSIHQYHQIYQCTVSWFSLGAFSLNEEHFMLSFIKMSALYEVYVLAKLISHFKLAGYSMEECGKITYPVPATSRFQNAHCNNIFVFKKENRKITIYYQPVIYGSDMRTVSGIGLYRNNSIAFPDTDAGSYIHRRNGHHTPMYTPDYVLKYENEGVSDVRYLIADAKFSTIKTVKTHQVARLAYQYLFSIAPMAASDHIVGLCIFNGQSSNDNDQAYNIYDLELEHPVAPIAQIVTLTENAIDSSAVHEALLHNAVGIFVTNPPRKITTLPRQIRKTDALMADQPEAKGLVEPTTANTNDGVPINDSATVIDKGADTQQPLAQEGTGDEASNDPRLGAPVIEGALSGETNHKAQSLVKPKSKTKQPQSDPMLLDITVLKLDTGTTQRLKDANIFTIKDLVPNRSKHDLANNTLLNRKLRREIEARLKQIKINLNNVQVPLQQARCEVPALPSLELKIGEFVHTAMRTLSESGYVFTEEAIDQMCTAEWTMKTFHTENAFMKRYVPGVTDNKGPDGKYVRFWIEPLAFGTTQVLISKEWFESRKQRDYFVKWYNSL